MRSRIAAAVLSAATTIPAQENGTPEQMVYGPLLATTVECGGIAGTTLKGLVIRCGDAGTVVFDTELLRVSAAWTDGWLQLRGTAYDGAHGPMPARRGLALAETRTGPGWSHDGSFADPRTIPYGPLPTQWGRFTAAQLLAGDGVAVEYRVGDMDVRETFAIAVDPRALVRVLELGPSAVEQCLVVLDAPGRVAADSGGQENERAASLQWQPEPREPVELAAAAEPQQLAIGGPAAADLLDPAAGTRATVTAVSGFDEFSGDLLALVDGGAAASVRFLPRSRDDDEVAGRLLVDLQRSTPVARIHVHGRGRQPRFTVYGSDAEVAPAGAAKRPSREGWRRLADVDAGELPDGMAFGIAIARGAGLGHFRHLLFVVDNDAPLHEIDVFATSPETPALASRPPEYAQCRLEGDAGPRLEIDAGRIVLRVPPHDADVRARLTIVRGTGAVPATAAATAAPDLTAPSDGPPAARWGEPLVSSGSRGPDVGPFAVDTIAIPFDNPFHSRMRTAALDFFADGRAAVSTWNGDVWIVGGLDDDLGELTWRRFATGLFDPLGLRIVDDVVHVLGRDGITRLVDTNGDGEADRHECFNNEVLITDSFHEFAFDLLTDAAGNFYFAKGAPVRPGGRGFTTIAPHHGTILRVPAGGHGIEVIATGLRAPNGIGVSPDGVVTSGDNEGTYMPRCRINWITAPGYYAGVVDTAHRTPVPDAPDPPLCWLPFDVDNSSGGHVWVTGRGWPDLAGRMLHLSYGTCSVFLVLTEDVGGQVQGGVVRLPAEFSSSCMRGRFAPHDGQLYVVGLQGWQTSAAREGGLHRVRRTQAPLGLPTDLRTCTAGVYLTFADALDPETAADPDSYAVEIWNYLYSSNYGSPEVSVLEPERQVAEGKPNRDALSVTGARLSPDRRTVFLAVDGMRPVHQMRIAWNVDAADGRALRGELHNTIHALAADPGFPAER